MEFSVPLKRPLVFFDLETTGLDPKYDRIIEIGAIKIFPDGKKQNFSHRINPGMRIPAEITQLTGITNESAQDAPTFAHLAPEVAAFFENADLAGYHINRFDVKVLVEEFRRVGYDFRLDGRAVVDMQAIFHQKEKRDLAAAVKFYCNKELKNAHSAMADTSATLDVFLAQLERYPDLPKDIAQLHEFCRGGQERFVDGEGKFFWRDGEAIFNFGRFKSQSLRTVAQDHPEYLHWVLSPERQFSAEVIEICRNAQAGKFPIRKSD